MGDWSLGDGIYREIPSPNLQSPNRLLFHEPLSAFAIDGFADDLNGNFLYSWGAPGGQLGRLNCPHGLSTDQERNLYVADCFGGRVQKFTPLPTADPAKVMGQIFRYPVRN